MNFNYSWEQRKVGEILKECRRPIHLEDDKEYQLITVKRNNGGIFPREKLYGRDILVKSYFIVRSGDFLISKRQVVHGANGFVPEALDGSVVSNEYLVVVESDLITPEFWSLLSKTSQMYRMYMFSSYGVDIEKLFFDVEDWKKKTIWIPSTGEQRSLVDFFKGLEKLITLHQR